MRIIRIGIVHLINFYIPNFSIYRLPFLSLEIMEAAASYKLEQLVNRLDNAERRAKLITLEIKSIKREISGLRCYLSSSTRNNRPSTSNYRSESSSGDDEDNADGPSDERKRFKSTFDMENDYVVMYTDGACENNGKPNAKAGIGVWFGDNHPQNISKPVNGKATNNTAEIQACVQGLQVLDTQGYTKAKIFTDSQFTINCMTKWIKNWKLNSWKTASGGGVKNKEDLEKLDAIVKKFADIKWVHVAGHQGIKGNEGADKLARAGASQYKP